MSERECLSEQQIRQAFREYKNGKSIDEVAEKYYVSSRTLQRMFQRRKFRKKKSGAKCR